MLNYHRRTTYTLIQEPRMELSSDFVGTLLKERHCAVTARWTMNYAAAIGDANPLYFNDERTGGIIAPPVFPVAITWPLIEKIADNIDAKDFPREILFTQVHYTEHLRIHRPVKPGDSLTVRGAIAAIHPHRAGTRVIIRFEAEDAAGTPVFTEHVGAMMRGVQCTGGGKENGQVPAVPDGPGDGALLWEAPVPIGQLVPFIYDGCSDIHFPIHTSVKFAHQVGLPGIILQGTATLAIAVRDLLAKEADGDSSRVEALSCRFSGMVLPGSDINVRCTGKKKTAEGTDLFFDVLNAGGTHALSNGHIRLKI
jgi:acyl dehydratase